MTSVLRPGLGAGFLWLLALPAYGAIVWATAAPTAGSLPVLAAATAGFAFTRAPFMRFQWHGGDLLMVVAALVPPIAYCTAGPVLVVPAAALGTLLVDLPVHRNARHAAHNAARQVIALSAGGFPVALAGLPEADPGPWQALALTAALLVANAVRGVLPPPVPDQHRPDDPRRQAFTLRKLTAVSSLSGCAVLLLYGLETGQAVWVLLALPSLVPFYTAVDTTLAGNSALDIARRVLALHHVTSARFASGEAIADFAGRLRAVLGADVLWLHTTLPGGPAWVQVTAHGESRLLSAPPPRLPRMLPPPDLSGQPGPIPASALPRDWRAGVQLMLPAPDGSDAGRLVVGWTRPGGRRIAARMTSGALASALAGVARCLGTLSAQAHATHDLEQEQARLKAVVEHSDIAILALDGAGRVSVWNAAMAALTGIPAGDAVGQDIGGLLELRDSGGVEVRLHGRPHGSLRLVTRTGRELWVRVSCSASERSPVLLTAAFVDESAHRQLDYLRRTLVSAVHHELSGPLTVIRGHTQLLAAGGPAAADDALSLEAIEDATDVMQAVLRDLTRLVDVNDAWRPGPAEAVDLGAALRRTLRSMPAAAARAELADAAPVVVMADPIRLRQCLSLVLNNAEKYAPEGGLKLTVRRDGSHGEIVLADQGPGIPAWERDLVMRPYYRSGSAGSVPGSGMGLHIAHLLMSAMNGRIRLDTAAGGGLAVTLRLPLAAPAPEPPPAAHPGESAVSRYGAGTPDRPASHAGRPGRTASPGPV